MILLLPLLAGAAWAQEYRQIELVDGRTVEAVVDATGPTGLTLRVPAGRMDVPFESVLRIDPSSAEAYAAQPPWRVLLLPTGGDNVDRVSAALAAELRALPGVRAVTPADLPAGDVQSALATCAVDVPCVRTLLARAEVDIALVPTVVAADGSTRSLSVHSAWRGLDAVALTGAAPLGGDAAARQAASSTALHLALGLVPPPAPLASPVEDAPVAVATTPEPTPLPSPAPTPEPTPEPTPAPSPTRSRTTRTVPDALSFVPLPGLPEFASGHPGRGLAALGVVAPATAGMVWLSGRSSSRKGELIALSAAGYYALCVTMNRAFMPAVLPREGGVELTVGGTF